MKDIVVPKMSMGTTEIEIMAWKVKVGDSIEPGQPLVEIESEKVNFTMESEFSGVITEILYKNGESVPIGKVICRIEENN